jgi:hypothetical protein
MVVGADRRRSRLSSLGLVECSHFGFAPDDVSFTEEASNLSAT